MTSRSQADFPRGRSGCEVPETRYLRAGRDTEGRRILHTMPPSSKGSLYDEALLEFVEGEYLGVLLYGSVARGDARPDSDLDLLQLVHDRTEHYQRGHVSVAVYTDTDLRRMCEAGSLFALHLVTEGRILADEKGHLERILSAYRPPPSYALMWQEIRSASAILDAGDTVIAFNPIGLSRLGLYLLRCAAMIQYIERFGSPSFAIDHLAQRLGLQGFAEVFADREDANLDRGRLSKIRNLLRHVLGRRVINPFGTLEAGALLVGGYPGPANCPPRPPSS